MLGAFLLFALLLRAATPTVGIVSPLGGQRGTEIDITITGARLADAQELFLYKPGITVTKLEAPSAQQVVAHLQIAADAPLGEHPLRVRTASGVSDLFTFQIGPFPTVAEAEPNSAFDQPQKIDFNVTIAGVVENEDVDYFVVEAKAGQRITAEIEAMRLGIEFFDPYVAILDEKRFEIAASDDTSLHLQDSIASVVAPADGKYIVQVRDSSYGGNGNAHYRLHVGTYPRPTVVYPPGGQVGQELATQMLGDVAGAFAQTLTLPAEPAERFAVVAEQDGQIAPSANALRVSSFANVLETEPNNDAATATPAAGELRLAFNGILQEPGDVDYFKFTAKQGQWIEFQCWARRLGSPADPVITIHDAAGGAAAGNDDQYGPDSGIRYQFPADGEYVIYIHDQLRKGGPSYAYRIETIPDSPNVALSIPLVTANSQERQSIVVPRGNRFATLVRATRANVSGPLAISATNLPAGVTLASENVAENIDTVPVVFEAAVDAPVAGTLADLIAAHADPNVKLASRFAQTADLVVAGNQIAYYQSTINKLAVAVAEEAPFKLELVQPKAPIVQNGSMQLKIVATRKEGFNSAINVQLLFAPPGIGTQGVTIAEGATEALIPLSSAGDAQVRTWKTCVIGYAEVNGPLWVSSQLIDLNVASPFIAMKIEMAAGEQGKETPVLCKIEPKTPFEGKAKVQLVGLPPNTSAPEMEISAADTQIIFPVTVAANAPTGQHNTLMCVVTPIKDGEPVIHNVGQGGVLRIDAPPPAPVVAEAAPAPAEPAPAPAEQAPVLSRLEKLRQEQAVKN